MLGSIYCVSNLAGDSDCYGSYLETLWAQSSHPTLSVEFIDAMAVPKVGGAVFAAVCFGQAGIDGKYIRSWQRTF